MIKTNTNYEERERSIDLICQQFLPNLMEMKRMNNPEEVDWNDTIVEKFSDLFGKPVPF